MAFGECVVVVISFITHGYCFFRHVTGFRLLWLFRPIQKLFRQLFSGYLIKESNCSSLIAISQIRVSSELSEIRPIASEVPQGSKLSLLLFSLFSFDILNHSQDMSALYANDIDLTN